VVAVGVQRIASRLPAGPARKKFLVSCERMREGEFIVMRTKHGIVRGNGVRTRGASGAQTSGFSSIDLARRLRAFRFTRSCRTEDVARRRSDAGTATSRSNSTMQNQRRATGAKRSKTSVLGRNFLTFALQFTGADVSFPLNSSPSGRSNERRSRPPRSATI
jgi:hypothetical protein